MVEDCVHTNFSSAVSGYDVPVFGVGRPCFHIIHITAVVALGLSFISTYTVSRFLFKTKRKIKFSKWHTYERFLVYRCVCDASYAFIHSLDHLQIIIANDHVKPKGLCILYAVLLLSICISQNLLTFTSALNAFLVVYFKKNLNYGTHDRKLLIILTVSPFVVAMIAFGFDVLGPSGFL